MGAVHCDAPIFTEYRSFTVLLPYILVDNGWHSNEMTGRYCWYTANWQLAGWYKRKG